MSETHEELAIIEGVGYGLRDVGQPVLWFGVKKKDGGSLQVLSGKQADQLIRDYDLYEVHTLNGKACIVEISGNTMFYKRAFKG